MSTGSTRSSESSPGGSVVSVIYSSLAISRGSDVKEANILRVAGDKAPPGVDVLAHQDGEQLVSRGGVIEGDPPQHPDRGIHCGFPQLLGVHLTEPFVALDAVVLVDLLS